MQIFNQIKKYSIITSAFSLLIGVVFIAFPQQCQKYTSLAIGALLIIMGCAGVISYLKDKISNFSLVLGIIVIITGIVVCVKYQAIISIFVALFGVYLLITGIFNLITSIKIVSSDIMSGWLTLALSVISCIFGIVAIFRAGDTSLTIIRFIGAALIAYAVIDIIAFIQLKKVGKTISDIKQDIDTSIAIAESDGDIDVSGEIVE